MLEAEKAVENIERWLPDGWIIDAEKEFKSSGSAARADQYMTYLASILPEGFDRFVLLSVSCFAS